MGRFENWLLRCRAVGQRLPRLATPLLAVLCLVPAGCGGAAATLAPPARAVDRYVAAVRAGNSAAAYTLLDEETRAQVSRTEFGRLMRENHTELVQQAKALARAAERAPEAQARVQLRGGQTVTMVLEDGRWRIEGGVLDAPSLRTPRDAVVALREALQRRSIAGVERILARQPRAEVEAEIRRVVDGTSDPLDLSYEVHGNNAVVHTTDGRGDPARARGRGVARRGDPRPVRHPGRPASPSAGVA